MQNIENIILYCLKQLNGERTIYSIYHLLNGKKSSQTIQDAHLYSLKKFFRIFESLTRESFDELVQKIIKKNFVYECGEQQFLPTASGEDSLKTFSLPAYINGWKFHQVTSPFWERLSLLVQVTSNLVYHETRYTPIQKNKEIHIWLKRVLKEFKPSRDEMAKMLLSELTDCFESNVDFDPSVLVFRLTGFQQIGLTPVQTAKMLHLDNHDYHIEFINILHFLIQTVEENSTRFPLLSCLLRDLTQSNTLTLTARKTWNLLEHGYSIEQIVRFRHLKLSTIEDHLVEFALNLPEFTIEPYVDKEMEREILDISRQSQTRQLKIIRNSLKTATYFQIRLVLAKYGDSQWN